MTRAGGIVGLVALVASSACGNKDSGDTGGTLPATTPAAATGPVRVAFGDCAGASTVFVSGPRPTPFDGGALGSAPTPPAPALDEGKMGRRESTREVGRYAIERDGDGGDDDDDNAFTELTGTADFSSGVEDAHVYGGVLGDEPGSTTGQNTMGPGRSRRTGPTPPRVRAGKPMIEGDLDRAIVRRILRRKYPQLKHCYEKQLLVKPGIGGVINTSFTIAPTGKTMMPSAEGFDPEVASCVVDVLRATQFPKPRGGGIVKVNYPFTFEPPRQARSTPTEPYRAGADNPLRSQASALEACFKQQTAQPFAAAVVELSFDDEGAVTASKTHGIDDAGAAACIATAARTATLTTAAGSTRRCGLAFGTMTVAQAPGIDIDDQAVRFAGAEIARVAELAAADTRTWKLPPLYDALRPGHAQPPRSVVSITGPVPLRAVDAAPMKVVNRVLLNANAAEARPELAVQRGGQWTLLRGTRELPEVPVPFGASLGIGELGQLGRDPQVKLSVLVEADALWLGLSQVREVRKIEHSDGKPDWSAFDETLREYGASPMRASGPFANAVEIAGGDSATYGQVVTVIERAGKAGLTEWQLLTPSALSVRFRE